MPVPTSDAEKRAILSSQEAQVNGQFELAFQGYITLLRSGDELPLLEANVEPNGGVSTTETIKYGTQFDTAVWKALPAALRTTLCSAFLLLIEPLIEPFGAVTASVVADQADVAADSPDFTAERSYLCPG